MSSSEKSKTRKNGELRVTAPQGVGIEIVDGKFRTVATGARLLVRSLPEGLYSIRWGAAGRAEERLIRLKANKTLLVDGGMFPLGGAAPSSIDGSSKLEQEQFHALTKIAVTDAHGNSPEIVIFVRSPNRRVRANVSRSLRLIDANNGTVHSGKTPAILSFGEDSMLVEGWAARTYRVPAGIYRLRYMSDRKRIMEQVIYAIAGRKTIAFLKYGASTITVKSKASATTKVYRGITPCQSIFLSVPIDDGLMGLQEHIHVASILLHKIDSGESFDDQELANNLASLGQDPFLQIYAAALLLGPREGLFKENCAPEKRNRDWEIVAAAALIDALGDLSNLPDVIFLSWRLAARSGKDFYDAYTEISVPPMLECSWRWASAYSIGDFRNEMIGAAALTPLTYSPWLAWDVADLHAKVMAQEMAESETRFKRLAEFVEKFQRRLDEYRADALNMRPGGLVDQLSTTTIDVANASVVATQRLGASAAPEQIAKVVAYSTGTPPNYLKSQFDQAFIEFERLEHLGD